MRFRSVNAAIKWALDTQSRDIVTTSRFGHVGGGELSAHEQHAQAEFILLEVGKLPHQERMIVAIKFGAPRIELAMAMADAIGHCTDRLVTDCVMAYQADLPSIRVMSDKHKKSVGTVQAVRKRVFDKLDPIYRRAMAQMELRLADLIERAA